MSRYHDMLSQPHTGAAATPSACGLLLQGLLATLHDPNNLTNGKLRVFVLEKQKNKHKDVSALGNRQKFSVFAKKSF